MKKLLCILSGMNVGGAETFLMKVFRKIDKTKYVFDFCVNNENNFYADEIRSLGGEIHIIPEKSRSLKEFRKGLYNVVKTGGYEYVLRITSSAMGFMDLKIAKKAGAKVCAARSSNSSDGGDLKALAAHIAGRLLYGRYVDVRIAPSPLAAEYTFGKKSYRAGKVKLINNGIDLNVYKYDEQARQRIREEFGISDNVKVLGHVGRFAKQKNHEFLIDIFADFQKREPESVLLLVGKGELMEETRKKAVEKGLEKSVIFAGLRNDVPDILSAFDAFVFPSFYEGMPNTVIEAQAAGVPCVISDTIDENVNVTRLVSRISLSAPTVKWVDEIDGALKRVRKDTKEDIIKAGYDIDSAAKNLIEAIFEQ